ncbi:hypothetical protein [Metabacillus sp. SLBN-84]
MVKKKSLLIGVILILAALFTAACSGEEDRKQEETAVNEVLNRLFTGPDETFADLMLNPKYRKVVNGEEKNEKLDAYIKKEYGPYMTEDYLNTFLSTIGAQYTILAYENGYTLSLKNLTVKQDENQSALYMFSAEVGYQHKNGEEKTANVDGEALFSTQEKEKIQGFQNLDDDGLAEDLREAE